MRYSKPLSFDMSAGFKPLCLDGSGAEYAGNCTDGSGVGTDCNFGTENKWNCTDGGSAHVVCGMGGNIGSTTSCDTGTKPIDV